MSKFGVTQGDYLGKFIGVVADWNCRNGRERTSTPALQFDDYHGEQFHIHSETGALWIRLGRCI